MKSMNFNGISCVAGLFNSAHALLGRRASLNYTASCPEILLIEAEGVVYVNDAAHTVAPGTVLCLRPGDECRLPLPYRAYYVRFADVQGDLLARMEDWNRVLLTTEPEIVVALIRDIADAQEKEDLFAAMSALLGLLSLLEHACRRADQLANGARKKTQDSLRAGLDYMDAHYCEKCTLKEIAASADKSPIYFHDVFSEAMGITPYEYMAQLRLKEAKRRLALTTEEPGDIATSCGFCSQSYFNFVFKKAMGMTPLHYRRALASQYLAAEADAE